MHVVRFLADAHEQDGVAVAMRAACCTGKPYAPVLIAGKATELKPSSAAIASDAS